MTLDIRSSKMVDEAKSYSNYPYPPILPIPTDANLDGYLDNWPEIALATKNWANWKCEHCGHVHELMYQHSEVEDQATRELEAEAVAYIVVSHFKIPGLASPNYLALWGADKTKITARLDRIRKTASEIINRLEGDAN